MEEDPLRVSEEGGIVGGLFARIVLVSICLALMAALATLASSQQVGQASQVTTAVGIDADSTGNTDNSLGNIDACISVAPGQTFDVDIFVADVVDFMAWQAVFIYDPSVLRVTETNAELFLASGEPARTLDLSDVAPNDDGSFEFAVVAITSSGQGVTGSGPLARVKLEAVAAGTSFLTLDNLILGDSNSLPIGDVNGDELFDGAIGYAQVWVGEPCPSVLPSPTPSASPTATTEETPEATPEATTPTTAVPSTPAATPGPGQPTVPSAQPSPQATASVGGDDSGFPWAVVIGASAATIVAALVVALGFRWLLRRAT
jgi:cell division septation protein DedD